MPESPIAKAWGNFMRPGDKEPCPAALSLTSNGIRRRVAQLTSAVDQTGTRRGYYGIWVIFVSTALRVRA